MLKYFYNYCFLVIFSFQVYLFLCQNEQNSNVGNPCIVEERNISGTCKLLNNCPHAVVKKDNNKTNENCDREGEDSLVCCPNVGEISKQKCWEYGEEVFEKKDSGTFSLIRRKVNVSTCINEGSTFVIGGLNAKDMEFPHMALLGYGQDNNKQWLCGGSLISDQYVLTAAHCILTQRGKVKWVRLGELNKQEKIDTYRKDFEIKNTIKYPKYKRSSKYHDIALIQLASKVKFSPHIRPACLNTLSSMDTSMKLIATGWGLDEQGGELSNHLQKVSLDQYSHKECFEAYESDVNTTILINGIDESIQICAGGKESPKDTCVGDSGGPLQAYHPKVYCMLSIVGVTSFGKTACGIPGIPGVYVKVSQYIEWIENIVWI